MANNDVVDRNKILGSATQDYGFDKVLRGYDIKQVNEYISIKGSGGKTHKAS